MAAIPGIELLAAAWGIAALLVVISLIWNRPLNLPVLTMPIALSESSSRQTPFVTHFADEYELWIEFVTEGPPPDGWKRLFGFGVPPFPGVPVLVQWEVLDCCNNTIITAGESESTSGNSFSGGLVGRRLARLKLPQGRLLLRVTIPRKVALLLSTPLRCACKSNRRRRKIGATCCIGEFHTQPSIFSFLCSWSRH